MCRVKKKPKPTTKLGPSRGSPFKPAASAKGALGKYLNNSTM